MWCVVLVEVVGGGAIDISARLRCCTTLSDNPKGNCDLTEITLAEK